MHRRAAAARDGAVVGHGGWSSVARKLQKCLQSFHQPRPRRTLSEEDTDWRFAATLALTALPSVSFAEDASPLSFNLSVTSDYRYRGISQTRPSPPRQGGADYALPGGFYIGAWASTIKWIKGTGT